MRGATARLINTQLKKTHAIRDVRPFWPMPWDEEKQNTAADRLARMTKEERRQAALDFLRKIGDID